MATIADISQTLGDYMLKGWVRNFVYIMDELEAETALSAGFDRPTLSNTWLHRPHIKISPGQDTTSHLLCQV